MVPQQFCKRVQLKVYSQCFLGTEKNSPVSVVHFPDLETKQYFVKSRYKRLRKEDMCRLLNPVLQLYILFFGNRGAER